MCNSAQGARIYDPHHLCCGDGAALALTKTSANYEASSQVTMPAATTVSTLDYSNTVHRNGSCLVLTACIENQSGKLCQERYCNDTVLWKVTMQLMQTSCSNNDAIMLFQYLGIQSVLHRISRLCWGLRARTIARVQIESRCRCFRLWIPRRYVILAVI